MCEQLKTLIEARDRSLSRMVDYDLKVMTLLIGLATAWSLVSAVDASEETKENAEAILALAGLIISLAWSGRRQFLWKIDDECAIELKKYTETSVPAPSVRTSWNDLTAVLANGSKFRVFELSVATWRFVTAWSMRRGEIFAILSFAAFSYMALDQSSFQTSIKSCSYVICF